MKMKYILMFLISFSVTAGELSFQISELTRDTDDDIYQVGGWNELQVSYQPTDSEGYLFMSYGEARVAPKGYAFTFEMLGLGAGMKREIFKNINVFGQLGYYLIENSWGGRKREFNEGLYAYLNGRYQGASGSSAYKYFNEYEVKNDNAFGGTIGIEMMYPLSKTDKVGFVFSKRIMKIRETVIGYKDEWGPGSRWEYGNKRNFNSTNFGINYIHTF